MKTRDALGKIFIRPRAFFFDLREEPKWVHAVIFMALLLTVQNIATNVATSSTERRTSSHSETPFADASYENSNGIAVERGAWTLKPRKLRPTGERVPLELDRISLVQFIHGLTFATILLPLTFGGVWLFCVFDAVYLRIVGAVLKLEYTIEDWFALSVWSRVPGFAVTAVAVIVGIGVLGRQTDIDEFEVLSFARWMELPVYRSGNLAIELTNLDVALLWSIALQTIGFKAWVGKDLMFSLAIIAAPTVIFTMIAIGLIALFV